MKARRRAVAFQEISVALALSLMPLTALWAKPVTTAASSHSSTVHLQSAFGRLPLSFEANQGQWDPSVQFVTRGPGHQLFLTSGEAVLALSAGEAKGKGRGGEALQGMPSSSPSSASHSVVRVRFDGGNPHPDMVGLDELPGIVNYILGDDSSRWRTNVPTYQKVEYTDVYPGVDLVYYGNQNKLEYDFIVAPGADSKQIIMAINGVNQIELNEQGDLLLDVPQSKDGGPHDVSILRMHKPVVYQLGDDGDKHLVAGTYVLLTSETSLQPAASAANPFGQSIKVAFQVGTYDKSRPLIIDPVLSWSTYLGSSGEEFGTGIAVDQAGQAYVIGNSNSGPGIGNGPIENTLGGGGRDVFVAKLNAAGTALLYVTYLGSSGSNDTGTAIAVDRFGQAYLTGETGPESDFPGTAGSLIQSTLGGVQDAFVAKLNASGTGLVYATYLGGNLADAGFGIAVDESGQAYVTGVTYTQGAEFPGTAGSPIQNTSAGNGDAFVAKINASGTALVYSTYLGGTGEDRGQGIAVDRAGNAYITGYTHTPGSGFPGTAGSLIQNTFGGGIYDAFVTKLNAAGTALLYSTYLGGSGTERGIGIAVDGAGQAYVTGWTYTTGSGFPGTAGSLIQSISGGRQDAYVAKLNANGTALIYSTYLGGAGTDRGFGIAVDGAGQAYVTGDTGFGLPGTAGSPIQATPGGAQDAFVAKLNAAGSAIIYATYLGGSGDDLGFGIAVDQAGYAFYTEGGYPPKEGRRGRLSPMLKSTPCCADVYGRVRRETARIRAWQF